MPSFLCRYVDVILQLIDKAGDFVSDDIWFRVVQFVTNNEDLQVCLELVTMILLPNMQNIHWAFDVFFSLMLRQKRESILINLLYTRQWLRFVFLLPFFNYLCYWFVWTIFLQSSTY